MIMSYTIPKIIFKSISKYSVFILDDYISMIFYVLILYCITSHPINIIWGHGLLSSSSIFDNNLSNLYIAFDNNYEIDKYNILYHCHGILYSI